MARLGWDHSIVEPNVEDRLIVAIPIISARRHAMSKRHNRLIVHSHQMLLLIVLVGGQLSMLSSQNPESTAQHRYLTAKRNVRNYFHVDISASRYVTMEIADHVWKPSRSPVAAVELRQTVCVIKALKNRHPALEFAARRSTVGGTNVGSVAVLERRKQVNDKPQNASIVEWQLRRTLSRSISVLEFVVDH